MKDKLVKTNHKKFYYGSRKVAVTSFLCLGMMLSFALPTYFSMKSAETESLHAEEKVDAELPLDTILDEESDY